ncbi:MAG: carboxypeptidase regulatory-like domain-containing protein, partial [Candidatus Hydrogenedentes bacterium]|nr:carboxypeptidase regulatory-like domain-containing protein [Candidatus Hydrogenedentota bacterium]
AYIARYEIPNFTSYITRSERGGTPAVTHMELGNGWVTVRPYGGAKDGQTESYQVPNGAVFDPNSRPDPYAAAFILVQLGIRNGTGPETTTVYDWDNTGKGMASYDIQMENVGKETITVPAGTFEAQHYVQKQLTFGDTWYKKRPGHITDFWVDDGIILRVLRHREPYEVVLASVEVGQHWLNPTAAPPTAPDASAAPPAQSTQPAVPVTDEATSAEIEAHYAKADAEVQEYIRWTARTFGRSGLWYPAGAFEQLSAEEREQKVQHMVESLNGEYGRHLCGALAEAGAIKDARLVPGLMKQASYHREDSDYDCRPKWMAVSALGRQDDISAVPTLVPLVDHGNTNTRMWARASLARLTDQWFSDDKQAWGKWWNDSGHGPQINLDELKPWAPPGQAAASSAAPEAGAAAVPAAAATPQTTVTGRVTDTQEKPIANARVVIRGGDHAPMLYEKAETGEDGRYSVTAKPGDWRLSVYADGFATLSRSHTVSEGVNPGWDFVLPVSAHVSGRMTDSEGKPAAIRVLELWPIETGPPPVPGLSFEPTGGEKPPVTQSDGRFELPDVAPGKYSIVVYGESPFGGDRSVQQVPIRGRLLDVQSGQRIEDLEIVVNPPEQFALSGHVRTAQGGPIRGIVVDTFIPHGRHWWTKTDENGAYRLEGLDGMGQSTFDMFFNDVPSGGSYKVVRRAVPLNSANVDLIVPENGGISGTVRNAKTGEAVSGYEVKVPLVHLTDCGVDWEEPQVQIERQKDNTFSIANVPAGEAVIEVRAGGLGVQHFTAAVKAGETLPLACDMLGPAVLEGMTTVDGQPKSAGVIVDGEWLNSDDAGKFHFEQFPNGEHIIGFFVDNGRHRTAEVTLKSGEATRVDVELGGSSIIRGTVQFSEDEPFCMCTVRLAAKPSPDGWYESGHPEPKEYVLAYSKMRKSGETYELRGIPAGTWYLMAGVHRAEMWRSILAHSQTIEVKENETLTIDLDLTQAN